MFGRYAYRQGRKVEADVVVVHGFRQSEKSGKGLIIACLVPMLQKTSKRYRAASANVRVRLRKQNRNVHRVRVAAVARWQKPDAAAVKKAGVKRGRFGR